MQTITTGLAAGGHQHEGAGADQRPGYWTPAANRHRVIRRNDHPSLFIAQPSRKYHYKMAMGNYEDKDIIDTYRDENAFGCNGARLLS